MDWMSTAQDFVDNPWAQWAVEALVRAIAGRVRRGRSAAGAHSVGAGPIMAPFPEGTEKPVSVNSGATGVELAAAMLQGVGNEQMRAATRLLGSHRDGFWLRRFSEDQELVDAAGSPLIDGASGIDWDALARLMRTPGWSRRASGSEVTVLEFAVSLAGDCAVNLRQVVHAVDDSEFKLLQRALQEAAYGDAS
ncbi:hypothetical protein [Streptomyces goshikiensis]|uniref:hypothetical protein n=1 Tax=Streptomyces goshikiensis TaxID=1942 RepID=UPI0033A8DF24